MTPEQIEKEFRKFKSRLCCILSAASDGGFGEDTLYNSNGSLDDDRIVDLEGHSFEFTDSIGGNDWFSIDPNPAAGLIEVIAHNTGDNGSSGIRMANSDATTPYLQLFFNNTLGVTTASIDVTDTALTFTATDHEFAGNVLLDNTLTVTGITKLLSVPVHADNAAAILAGLAVGTIYRTGDALKIVH